MIFGNMKANLAILRALIEKSYEIIIQACNLQKYDETLSPIR